MEISLQDWLKSLTKIEKNKLEKMVVRELDEENKNYFVAFVDEKEQSYDVHVQLKEGNIIKSTCDCLQDISPCLHQHAVWYVIANNGVGITIKKVVKNRKSTSKAAVSANLLQSLSKEELTDWLVEIFKKNKVLEQQFVVTFSQEQKEYTVVEVNQLMQQTFLAVAGKRKTLEGVKIKKILDTLTIAFKPINDFIVVNIHQPIAYDLYIEVMNTMQAFDKRISHYSKKFNDFYESYSLWFALNLNNVQDIRIWENQVQSLLQNIFIDNKASITANSYLAMKLYEHASNQQQSYFGKELYQFIRQTKYVRYDYSENFIIFIRTIALEYDYFDELTSFFKPFSNR